MIPKDVTKDDFLLAVKEGVKEAILIMTESGDGSSGPIIREPFLEAIKEGVEAGMPLTDDINRSLMNGVSQGMPFNSDILDAIYNGTENGVRNG